MARTYANFDLLIVRKGDGYEVRVASSPAGEAVDVFEPPFSETDLENFRLRHPDIRNPRLKWHLQKIRPGFFTNTMLEQAPVVRDELLEAMDRVTRLIARS